jgi:hypothetical protein
MNPNRKRALQAKKPEEMGWESAAWARAAQRAG